MIATGSAILGFFLGPLGRWVGLGLVLVALYGTAYTRGYLKASGSCEAQALRTANTILTQRIEALQSLGESHGARLIVDRAADELNRTRVDETPQIAGCGIDRDGARRVRAVR
jgi:hypothetical protein